MSSLVTCPKCNSTMIGNGAIIKCMKCSTVYSLLLREFKEIHETRPPVSKDEHSEAAGKEV